MRDLPRGTQVANHGGRSLSPTGLSPAMARLSRQLRLTIDLVTPPGSCRIPKIDSYNPYSETAATYRAELVWALPFSLATTRGIFSFPPATEMFQFAGLPLPGLFGSTRSDWNSPAGFPHWDISGSKPARGSPKLFAACRVLHRLLAPRHPPRALCSLTPSSSDQAARDHRGIGMIRCTRRNRRFQLLPNVSSC